MNAPLTRLSSTQKLALLAVLLAYILSFFHRFAPAGIASDLAASFQTSAASLGILAATYFYVYTVMQIPTGILVDTLGPRRVLGWGGAIAGIGSIIFGLAPSLEWALVGRTLAGLGVSVTFVAMLKLIALWFDEGKFASVVGVCILIGNLGSLLAGTPLVTFSQTFSWQGAFLLAGGVSLALGVLCIRWVNDGFAEGKRIKIDRTVILSGLLQVLRNRHTWPTVMANAGLAGSLFAFGGLWGMPWLTQVQHLPRIEAANHLSLVYAGFAIGCVVLGMLSDKLRRRKPVLIIASLTTVMMWSIVVSGVHLAGGMSHALCFAIGLSCSAFALTWPAVKEVNPPHLSGMSTSIANMGGFLSGALLQPLIGMVMDRYWHGELTATGSRQYSLEAFQAGTTLLLIAATLGAFACWWITETRCRNISAELNETA